MQVQRRHETKRPAVADDGGPLNREGARRRKRDCPQYTPSGRYLQPRPMAVILAPMIETARRNGWDQVAAALLRLVQGGGGR